MTRTRSIAIVLFVFLVSLTAGIAVEKRLRRHPAVSSKSFENMLALSEPTGEATLSHWTLIGPFNLIPDSATDGFARDYLANVGYPENTLSSDVLPGLCEKVLICRYFQGAGAVIPLFRFFGQSANSVAYAIATISSATGRDVVLEVGSSEGIFARVNGVEVISVPVGDRGDTAVKYHHMTVIHLHAGKNLLMLKANSEASARTWAMIASVLTMQSGGQRSIESKDGYLITNRLLQKGQYLQVEVPDLSGRWAPSVTVLNHRGDRIFARSYRKTARLSLNTTGLEDGYYTLLLTLGKTTVHDEFYIGRIDDLFRRVYRQRRSAARGAVAELIALNERYRILTSSTYSHPSVPDWQRKVLLTVREAVMASQHPHDAAWTKWPGMHLRQYISRLDHTKQYYLIYIPPSTKRKLPLVIDMPYAQRPQRPFLESSLAIGWPQALDDVKRAADHYGFVVAIVGGRGNVGDAPIGELDTFEALENISTNYEIDRRRIYLFGVCEGGIRALRLAERYPGMFAAVGIYGPPLAPADTSSSAIPFDSEAEIFKDLGRLENVPVKILQGEFDDVPPLRVLETYIENLRKVSPVSELSVLADGTHGTNASEQQIYPWFAAQAKLYGMPNIQEALNRAFMRTNTGRY